MVEERSTDLTPKVTNLFTTPIKGFALDQPSSVSLNQNGAVGDRDFFLVDGNGDLLSITRTGAFGGWHAAFDRDESVLTLMSPDGRTLEEQTIDEGPLVVDFWQSHDVAGRAIGGPWTKWLSEIADQPVTLVRADEPGGAFDETAVTVISHESVVELGSVTNTDDIDIRRFRMLINISGVKAYQEETWRSQTARIGSAVLRIAGPVPRCMATTRNPDSGDKDLKTLQLIAQARGMQPNDFGEGLNLGVYADVIEPGVVSVGDQLDVV